MLAPKLVKCLKSKEHYRTNSFIVNQFNTVFNALKASPRLSLQQGLGNLNTVETEEVTCSSTSKPPASILWYLSPSQPVFHPLHQGFSLFSTSAPLVFCIWRDFSLLCHPVSSLGNGDAFPSVKTPMASSAVSLISPSSLLVFHS